MKVARWKSREWSGALYKPFYFAFWSIGALFLGALVLFLSNPIRAEHLPVKTYTVADGLLRDTVSKIKQDSRGFLWFCTGGGLSRFDGIGMTNFTVADGLPNGYVEDFLETKAGTIYIATDKGLARLNPHGLSDSTEHPLFTIFLPENPNAVNIVSLFEDKNNQVWVGTGDGLYKLIETDGTVAFENVPLGEPLRVSGGAIAEPGPNEIYVKSLLEDRHGTLWIGTHGNGLFRRSPNGEMRRFSKSDELPDNKITDLLEDHEGRLWMSLRSDESGGLCLLDEEAKENPIKKCYTTKDGLGSNWIRDILETSDGQLWLATVPGLCRWQGEGRGSVCKTYSKKNDLCDDMLALAEDKDKNLWTGSSCGAKKISHYGFTTYDATDGLFYDQANSIFENSAGELFAAAFPKRERVISRFDGDAFSPVKLRLGPDVDYHGWGWQQTILQDRMGAWWIATEFGVLRSPDHTSFDDLEHAALKKLDTGGKEAEVFRLFEDSRGDIWLLTIGKTNELRRWDRAKDTWDDYTAQVGFSDYRVGSALVEDTHGNVWIGASSDHGQTELIRYRDGEFRILREGEGGPSDWIRDLFVDSRGRLWIASTGDGLWRLDETDSDDFEFIKYTAANGLTSSATACVTEDLFGRIYIGTWQGVDRLDPDTGQIENFTTADGLPASFVEISYRDRQNNLWFGTQNGLARFAPEPKRQRMPPIGLITGLRVAGVPQAVSVLGETTIPPLQFNSDQRQVTVDFLGLGASLGEKLKYEYRLGESEWTPTTERTVNFANLNSGEYHFEARAVTADRIYSIPATVDFSIATPLWQRWWFLALVLVLTSLGIYLFYKNRLLRMLEMQRMQTRIAADLHDDIGANLTRISLLSEVARANSANGNDNLLGSIANIARESVASMNDIVWAISPDHDRMLDLARRMRQHAEEVFTMRDIELDFEAPIEDMNMKLSVGVRRDVLLVFKEGVNNAARHSGCSHVQIHFRCENSILTLRIKDDGKGFDPGNYESDGQGLRSMARRSKGLGGMFKIDSRKDSGTIVEFELPLPNTRFETAYSSE